MTLTSPQITHMTGNDPAMSNAPQHMKTKSRESATIHHQTLVSNLYGP